MFSLEHLVDLPLIWYGLIIVAIFLYILLDGFDLGVGVLFPFAPSDQCRDRMMNSIAPFWDGNETWLVLGGGGLFAAFPLAYAILMPALYIPVIIMLLGLIFRGVAFEFRFKASDRTRVVWDYAFHFGSLTAAFMQGVIIGAAGAGGGSRRSAVCRRRLRLAQCLQRDDRRRPGLRLCVAGSHLAGDENRGRSLRLGRENALPMPSGTSVCSWRSSASACRS